MTSRTSPDNKLIRRSGRPLRDGFTLVEILIVIVILGILATVVVFVVRGVTQESQENACGTDHRILSTSAEVYMAQRSVDSLPATGAGADRYERTLIDAGLLTQVSNYYELDATGNVNTNGLPCT